MDHRIFVLKLVFTSFISEETFLRLTGALQAPNLEFPFFLLGLR